MTCKYVVRRTDTANQYRAADRDVVVSINVKGQNWKLGLSRAMADPKPRVWVTELNWEPPAYAGNLALMGADGVSLSHYFLEGPVCDYVAVQLEAKGRWALIARERSADVLTHEVVYRDMNALAFAFGTPFQLRKLFAVTENLDVIAVLGGRLMKAGNRLRRMPHKSSL